VRERTRFACYEDLTSRDRDLAAVNEVLDFLHNGTAPTHRAPFAGEGPGHADYSGGHATSKDANLRNRLKSVVQKIDRDYYGGDVAWVHSALPCQKRN